MNKSIIQKKISEIDWAKEFDQAKKVGKWAVDQVATLGLMGLLDQFKIEERFETFQESLLTVDEQVKQLAQEKISAEYLETKDCQEVLVNTFAEAISLRNISKLRYFRSAWYSGLLRDDMDKDKKLFFISCLSNISEPALYVLSVILHLEEDEKMSHISVQLLSERTGIKECEFLVAILKELDRFNLVEITWPQVKAENQSNVAFQPRRITKQFVQYITEYS